MVNRINEDKLLKEWSERIAKHIKEIYEKPTFKIELIGPIPVSLQAKSIDKHRVVDFLRTQTKTIPWIFTDDVLINVKWYINDRVRYENDSVPDIDNVLKPILDSLAGPEGVLIDDCQVVNVNITQLGGWQKGYERFDLEIRALNEYDFNWALKENLRFLNVKNGICWPVIEDREVNIEYLKECLEKYIDSDDINNLPMQRFYHISRVKEWKII